MSDKRKPLTKVMSPRGRAIFPKLDKPDTKFDAAGVYSVKLAVPTDAVADLQAKLQAELDEFVAEKKADLVSKKNAAKAKSLKVKDIFAPEYDDEGNETGNVIMSFKMKASGQKKDGSTFTRKPAVFDAKGKKLDPVPPVWGGSILKVAGEAMPYYMASSNECGVTLYMQGVQIIELKTGGGREASDYGFGEEDGFTAEENGGSEFSDETAADTSGDTDDF